MEAKHEANILRLTEAFWALAQRVWPGVMTDVVFWVNDNDSPRIAFVGKPLKIAQQFGMLDQKYETDRYLAKQIERAIVDQMQTPVDPHDWHGGADSLGEILDRFSGQTAWQWAEKHGDIGDEGVRVTFIPEPGWPWPAEGNRYWSAKKRQWLKSERPPWLIETEDRYDNPGKKKWGVNPCILFPSDETKTKPGGPVSGNLDGMPIMLTHSMGLNANDVLTADHKQLDLAVKSMKECGGFLFPSLAVGPIPATNFGPIVLVAHIELLLDSLLPYRKGKRRRPTWVYATDAWTITTRTAMTDTAQEIFSELHGHDDWYGRYIATLGVQSHTHGGGDWHETINSTSQLASALRKRFRTWKRSLTEAQFAKVSDVTGKAKYAYVESKAREVVSIEEFPFIVAPTFMKDTVDRFVRGIGYHGEVVLVEAPDLERVEQGYERRNYELYRWGWIVADVVSELRRVVQIET